MIRYTFQELDNIVRRHHNNFTKASAELNIPRRSFSFIYSRAKLNGFYDYQPKNNADRELVRENIRYKKQTQKYQDINRIERKAFRELARYENALEDLSKNILEKLSSLPKPFIPEHKKDTTGSFGLIHFADWHLNELVELDNNKFDWEIASKRLKKYVQESTRFFDAYGIKDVLVVNTGDTLNNDIILDKLLNNVENRANAVVSAFDLFRKVLCDFAKNFNVSVIFCDANETRLTKEIGYTKAVASNNFDSTLYDLLQGYFIDSPVKFLGKGLEVLVSYKGINILALHGHTWGNDLEKSVNKIIAKYALDGINIDYVCSGHIHSTYIGPFWSRSASLVGNNAYNYNALHINGRAGQNAIVFMDDGSRHALSIDLQEAKNEGYALKKELQSYNPTSQDKCHKETTILKIVV